MNLRPGLLFLGLPALLLVGYASLAVYQAWAIRDFAHTNPPPGQLVQVDNYRMHLNCTGTGPAIVLESGSGSWSMDWHPVQSKLSAVARVCSYDRAGSGWSDPRPEPRDIGRLTDELAMLLNNAEVTPPYILVGASFGGMIAQLFEARNPDQVRALVLIDGRPADYFAHYSKIVPDAQTRLMDEMNTIVLLHRMGLLAALVSIEMPAGLPAQFEALYRHRGRMTKQAVASARERLEGAANERLAGQTGHLGDKPLVVISHGRTGMYEGRRGVSTVQADALEAMFQQRQRALAGLSTNSRQVIARESGHAIQLDQPDLVASELAQLIAEELRPL